MSIFIRTTNEPDNTRGDYYVTLAMTGPANAPWNCYINIQGWNGSLVTDLGNFATKTEAILEADALIAVLRGV